MERALDDHGTHEDALVFALEVHDDTLYTYEFLKAWSQGNLGEWPEFYTWLEARRAAQPADLRAVNWIELGALIQPLRAEEASAVTLICDNQDGDPNNAVECWGDWTNFDIKRFTGDTLADALRAANAAMNAAKLPG